jgi:hypothetical protein
MESRSERRNLLATTVRPAPDVLVSRLGEETVMLDLVSERYFGLDSAGTAFWDVLTTAPSAAAGVDRLLDLYDVDRETLIRDVSALITQMKEKGLLQVMDAPTA